MPRSKLPVLLLLLATLASVAWLLWFSPETAVAPDPSGANPYDSVASDSQADAAAHAENTDSSAAPAIAEAPARTAVATGADGKALLRITTRTADGDAIGNVMVRVQRLHNQRISPTFGRGLSNEQGVIEFHDVAPGKIYISCDRGNTMDAEVTAGINEVNFEVKAGVDVQGRVLAPNGTPVAGADIWLQSARTSWDGGRVLGQTTDDGTFSLADVPADCSLGAIAEGYAPSVLVDLDIVDKTSPPAQVDLQLQPNGGELTGRVTDHDGAPIVGAQVASGKRVDRLDYTSDRCIEAWSLRTVETDHAGHYTIHGLKVGPTPLAVRADGFGIWRGNADILAGQTTKLDVQLERSAVLFGTVTDKDGAPESEARVAAYDKEPKTRYLAGGQIDFDQTFGHLETTTDKLGNYRLEGITPGTTSLFALRKRVRGGGVSVAVQRATLEVVPGSDVRWDAVIDTGRSVAGIVRYRDGHPVPRLFITLHNERTGEDSVINSDKNGAFRFLCLADATYEVRVQPPFSAPKGSDAPRRSGVVPDQGQVEIQLDYDKPVKLVPGTVRGRIADAGRRIGNPNAITLTLHSDARWFRPGIKVEGGAFRVEDIKPCRFRLVLKENDTVLACTDWHELPAAGDVDIGVLTTEPGGAVRIRVVREAGTENFEPKLHLRRDGAPLSTIVELGMRNEALIESLTPGDYEVSGYFKGMVSVKGKTTVTMGQTTDLQVDVRAGASGKVHVWWPENHIDSKRRGYRVVNAAGKTVQEYEGLIYTSPIRPHAVYYTLPAGRYHLEFWTDDDLRGELDFNIPASLIPPALRLNLK